MTNKEKSFIIFSTQHFSRYLIRGCHKNGYNDTLLNGTHHKNTYHYDTQQKNNNATLSIMILDAQYFHAECHVLYCYAECRYAECLCAEGYGTYSSGLIKLGSVNVLWNILPP